MIMIPHEGNDVFKGEPLRILFPPVIERRADRFGRAEARHVMAAVASQSRDGLSADIPLELIVSDGSGECPLVSVEGKELDLVFRQAGPLSLTGGLQDVVD